ncbi:MAG TPA: hypothetical protein VM452_04810 [Caulifigura sp.]|nr:hypothetical protein [Caulifigura sp.]
MAKLKKLFINHGEKILMAVIALAVLAGLAGADWLPYDGTPGQITSKVAEAERKWAPARWSDNEEEVKQFVIKPEDEPNAIVDANIRKTLTLSDVALAQKFTRSPYEQTAPLTNPQLRPIEDLIANSGRVLLTVQDEKFIKEMENFQRGLGPDGKPLPAGTFPGQPKPMDDIPDEFKVRNPVATGGEGAASGFSFPGGLDGGMTPPGSPPTGGRGKRGRGGAPAVGSIEAGGDPTMSGMGTGMAAGALPPGQTGRGFHYAAVRGVFPIGDQIYKIAEATNLPRQQAAMALEILDYRIERQTKLESGDPWGGPWEPVDINVATDVLTKMAIGLEPDVVFPQVTDPAMTMPLPARVSGVWKNDVTHPRIEKFTLTDEQIRQEVMFQEEALKKLEELKKELPPPPAHKAGWTTVVGGTGAQLNNYMMGGDGGMSYGAMGGGLGLPGESGGSSFPGGGMASMGVGGFSGVGGMQPQTPGKPQAKISPIDDLIKKSEKERAKEIQEYVKNVVHVVGELLLFRYIDFSVEPGKTYRYRARLVFRNPNFGRNVDEAAGDPSVVTGETRMSDWSEPTAEIVVQKDQQTFVTDVRPAAGSNAFPAPQLNVFQWDPNLGTFQQAVLNLALGQTISGKRRTDVLDPAHGTFEQKDYTFQSTDYIVDAQPDVLIEKAAHPDLELGTRGDLMLPEQVLVALSEGGVSILDPSVSKAEEQKWKSYHEQQNNYWKTLKESASAMSDPLMSGMSGMEGSEGGFGFSGRGLSPLLNKLKGKGKKQPLPTGP